MARRAGPRGAQGRVDTELEVSNFGPISSGRIALRPLTILVGPNNSGKTYASVLAHSVVSACGDVARAARSGDWAELLLEGGDLQRLSGRVARLAARGNGRGEAAVPPGLAASIHDCTVRRLLEESLLSRLRHNFGSPLGGLVRAGSRSSRIRIRGPIGADVAISRRGAASVRAARGDAGHTVARPRRGAPANGRGTAGLLELAAVIAAHAGTGASGASHYLPAARSGVMCAHGALAQGILGGLRNGRHGGATAAGTVSDMVDSLARARAAPRNGARSRGAGFVAGVLGGRLAGAGGEPGALSYVRGGMSVPMHMSSSGMANAAPLELVAAGMVPGDTLVVEEPEAHLHPKSQVKMAGQLVGLVRRGMRVILSTHSDFLLGQLDILVKLGSLTPSKRVARGYGRDDYVRDDEVAPYAFAGRATRGYAISELGHSAADGISYDGFINVVKSMSTDEYRIYVERGN